MIAPFSLKTPPKIIFGPGKLAELEDILPTMTRRPLLVLGSSSFLKSDHYGLLENIFTNLSLPLQSVHIASEPSPAQIDTIVADPRFTEIDGIVAIGGGSTLDAGKAISAMLVEGGEVGRFLEGVGSEKPSGKKLPFIAIPTTSGTGSEATSNAVLSSVGPEGYKSSLRHDNFIPDLALVDPSLTLSCPAELTVACAMDCFSQLVEGYLSTNSSPVTDALALDGIQAIERSLSLVCNEDDNLFARTDLSYATLLSGIVLANSGLGTVHGFASVIGGFFNIPHGLICGTLMAPSNKLTLQKLRAGEGEQGALKKYARLGQIFCSENEKRADWKDSWYQDYFIDRLEKLSKELNIARLSDYQVTGEAIRRIVGKTGNKYNPVQLSKEDLATILAQRID